MKKKHVFAIFLLGIALALFPIVSDAQCRPAIKIDGNITVADPSDPFGVQLPYWLQPGQTLSVGASVNAISVIEFTENGSSLEYSQVLNITSSSPQTVPSGKIWKIESVSKINTPSTYRNVTYTISGTYSWVVPACAEEICIEVWGGGGGGGGGYGTSPYAGGAGGGGGGFGSGCYTVVPGNTLSVIVGSGGAGGSTNSTGATGGSTSVGSLITAYGGTGGTSNSSGGTGGTGGGSTSANTVVGGNGASGASGGYPSGRGGAAGNGGAGGEPKSADASGNPGTSPGGGGGGGPKYNYAYSGGAGGDGKVIISW